MPLFCVVTVIHDDCFLKLMPKFSSHILKNSQYTELSVKHPTTNTTILGSKKKKLSICDIPCSTKLVHEVARFVHRSCSW